MSLLVSLPKNRPTSPSGVTDRAGSTAPVLTAITENACVSRSVVLWPSESVLVLVVTYS